MAGAVSTVKKSPAGQDSVNLSTGKPAGHSRDNKGTEEQESIRLLGQSLTFGFLVLWYYSLVSPAHASVLC